MPHISSKNISLFITGFLVFAIFWRLILADYFLMIPKDFTYSADIESVDNFYDEEKGDYSGPQYSVTEFSYQAVSATDKGLEIKNLFDVRSLTGEEIFSTQRIYGIDPKTGAHVEGLGDEDREGFLFAPRKLKEGEPYTYWHVNYDAPASMTFVAEEKLYGLKVYHYESYYEDVAVDQTADLGHLPDVPEEKGIQVSTHLEVWVEPVSGYLVKYQDESTAYYYDANTGETLNPWNHFSNTYVDESVEEHVERASSLKNKTIFLQNYLPAVFILLALWMLLCGVRRCMPAFKRKTGVNPLLTLFMTLFPIVGVASTWYLMAYHFQQGTELEFEERAEVVKDEIVDRIGLYTNTLQGSSGLFEAFQNVGREEWTTYVDYLDLSEHSEGVNAVGFAKVVLDEEKEAFIASTRAEGLADYDIYPEGTREVYAPVLYFQGAEEETHYSLGRDMYEEPVRNMGVSSARDTGSAIMSGKVELVTEEEDKVGFFIYAPIYKKGEAHETIEERRAAIYGYVYSRFRMSDLMDGIFGDTDLGLFFEVYDGTTVSEEQLLYRSAGAEADDMDPIYTKTETIYLAGHPWTLHFMSGDNFELSRGQKIVIYGALLGGLILVGLYLFTYYSLMIAREKDLKQIRKQL